jgi:hypothetical protein
MNLRYQIYDLRTQGAGDGCGAFERSGAGGGAADWDNPRSESMRKKQQISLNPGKSKQIRPNLFGHR